MRALYSLLVVMSAACLTPLALGDRVELRDGAPAVQGHIRTINDDGVTIEVEGASIRTISWDRIRDISPPHKQADMAALLDLSLNLWRGRTRVERGDFELAESIFAENYGRLLGERSETALVVMEGYLRCLLARGANNAAVIPALEVARLRQAGVTTESYRALPAVYDSATALCPYVPPFWVPTATLPKLVRQLNTYDAHNDAIVEAIADAYRTAAQAQAGGKPSETVVKSSSDHAGVRLMRSVLNVDPRNEAELVKMSTAIGPWAEAWARYGLGQAQLASDLETTRQEGLLNLLRVPAQWGQSQPYLSGLALAEVNKSLAETGRVEDADAVRAELQRAYPNHPIVATLPSGAATQATKGDS